MNGLEKKSNSKCARTARFGFRATPQQEALLRRAAEITGRNVTQFVLASACEAAINTLTDQKIFFADDETYQQFQDLLERPAQVKPKLRELINRQSPWEKKNT